jgi:acyl-coenzyme A thioesterase PaaI-like protein
VPARGVTSFTPQDPTFAERVRASFDKQQFMTTIGARLTRVDPGEVDIELAQREGRA